MSLRNEDLARLVADYAERRRGLTERGRGLGALSATACDPQNLLTVTVGRRGAITALRFNNRDYRTMTAEQLSTVVKETIAEATAQRTGQARALLSGGPGPDLSGVLDGSLDWSSLLPGSLLERLRGLGTLGATPPGSRDEPTD